MGINQKRMGLSWHPLGVSRTIFWCDLRGAMAPTEGVMVPKEGCHGTKGGVSWHQRRGVMAPTEGYNGTNGGVSSTIEEVSGCLLTPRLPHMTPFFGIWHPFGTSFWVRDTRKTPELGAKVTPKKGSIFDKVPTPEKGVRISISALGKQI